VQGIIGRSINSIIGRPAIVYARWGAINRLHGAINRLH
jgi:hypothetical protein